MRHELFLYKQLASTLDFSKLFSDPATEGMHVHVNVLDHFLSTPANLHEMFMRESTALLNKFYTAWSESIEVMASAIESRCPTGWQAKADTLCEDNALRESMLNNKEYVQIGPLTEMLESTRKLCKALNHDGRGATIRIEVLKRASDAVALGVHTVGTTYALHHVINVIPALGKNVHAVRSSVLS